MKYTFHESLRKNQCVDKNGNPEADENLNNNYFTASGADGKDDEENGNGNGNVNSKKQIDQKALRLQAMAMSDDDDYGEENYFDKEISTAHVGGRLAVCCRRATCRKKAEKLKPKL
jgi:hypothetical protein